MVFPGALIYSFQCEGLEFKRCSETVTTVYVGETYVMAKTSKQEKEQKMSKSRLNGQGLSGHHLELETEPADLDQSEGGGVKGDTAYSYVTSHVDNNSIRDWMLDQTTSRDFFQTKLLLFCEGNQK